MLNTASLPDGREFEFWEQEEKYSCELHVDCKNPVANDSNDGSAERPFRTIQAAAEVAEAGTLVLIHGEYIGNGFIRFMAVQMQSI